MLEQKKKKEETTDRQPKIFLKSPTSEVGDFVFVAGHRNSLRRVLLCWWKVMAVKRPFGGPNAHTAQSV